MRWRMAVCIFIVLAGAEQVPAATQEPAKPAPSDATQYKQVLGRYCFTCHNERLKTADLILSAIDINNPGAEPAVWEKVVRKLRTRQMPPAGLPRPDNSFYDSFATYLETALDRATAAKPNAGRPAVHRLNRAEYANAVRDLLGVEVDSSTLLPADDAGRGFDNNADVLSVSPLLVERYVAAAAKVSRLAVGDPSVRPFTESYDVSRRLVQDDRVSDDLPFGSRGGIAIRHNFPLDGEYEIKVRLQRNNDNYIRGLDEPHQLDVRLDGARIRLFTIGGEHKGRSGPIYSFINPDYKGDPEQEKYEFTADAALEVRFPARAGTRLVEVAFLKENLEPEGVRMPLQFYDDMLAYKGGDPGVDSVAITGPFNAKGLGDTPSRRKIFLCRPAPSKNGPGEPSPRNDDEACARKILTTLARRAYRRPVTVADIEPLLAFYKTGRDEAGSEAGITEAIQRMLVSPNFLFRVEHDPPNAAPGSVYRISDLDLASRLSFFLWSSMPDDQLLDLAVRGKLKDSEVLQQQLRRMLADSRSDALVSNFGAEWLNLRRLKGMSPDPKLFPDFDENLRDALEQETELFLASMIREDRPALEMLDADYTFVNERLARHYGIPNVFGSHFRRVKITDENRRGLLGQGSILTVTSYGNRTAPTLRGKWLLENVLGTPPPPPPPDVPSLKENGGVKILTMRQRMEQHRANPVCAVCHSRMDPMGFALENFDSLGRWRTTEGTAAIDPSGVLPDGTKFQGPEGLRKVLVSRPEQFITTLTEKLLTYALGRGIEYYDEPTVREIMRESAPNDYRWSSLILGVIRSEPFQMRTAREPVATAGL